LDTWDIDLKTIAVDGVEVPVRSLAIQIFHKTDANYCFILQYDVKPKHPVMGSALHIPLPKPLSVGSSVTIKIDYETTEGCIALQWLDKECVSSFINRPPSVDVLRSQTQGKNFPYLFSQCQPIYTRALAPLQGSLLFPLYWAPT
jgi:leukotriene-A4 hydrolase